MQSRLARLPLLFLPSKFTFNMHSRRVQVYLGLDSLSRATVKYNNIVLSRTKDVKSARKSRKDNFMFYCTCAKRTKVSFLKAIFLSKDQHQLKLTGFCYSSDWPYSASLPLKLFFLQVPIMQSAHYYCHKCMHIPWISRVYFTPARKKK